MTLSLKEKRLKRAKKLRGRVRARGAFRLCIERSNAHISAQIIAHRQLNELGDRVLACASTQEASLRERCAKLSKTESARLIGQLIVERAKAAGVDTVVFDRSGHQFHGRIKALAEAAREEGLNF